MANLNEAYNVLKTTENIFQNIDYFFTQRTIIEENEYIDKNMNRKIKKQKVIYNFLALYIPLNIQTDYSIDNNSNNKNEELHKIMPVIPVGFDIEIFGDSGYHYNGNITSHTGIISNFMIPINTDKKIFVKIKYNFIDNNKNIFKIFISFIDIPRRFQSSGNDIINDNINDNLI